MTPLPKRRHSSRRSGKRVAALRQRAVGRTVCPRCGMRKLPHRVCKSCGYYDAIPILKPKVEKEEKAK